MKNKHLITLFLVLVLGGLIFYRIHQNREVAQKSQDKQGKKPPITVKAMVLQTENFAQIVTLSGTLEANEQIEIHSEQSGIVEHIYFKEGMFVHKGEKLLQLNNDDLKAKLAEAVAKENLAAETERRNRILVEKNVVSREEYDIASANYKIAQAQSQLIRVQLAKTTIKAPFSGKIGLRHISAGTYITPNQSIANLLSVHPVKITFSIPEKYVQEVKLNSTIHFNVNQSNQVFTARIYAIDPGIDHKTRTLQVRALAHNQKGILIPGTFAQVTMPLQYTQAFIIPTEAVLPVQSGKKVYVFKNGKAIAIDIATINRSEKELAVTEGLKSGDTLIISGIMSLKDNAEVNVKIVKTKSKD